MVIKKILFITIFCMVCCAPVISADDWWNSNWLYRIDTTLNAVPAGGYQYSLTISADSGTNNATHVFLAGNNATNFDDIRFVLDGSTNLSYWVEDNSTNPITAWINVTDNGTVSLYYGNPSAESESDGFSTFSFFDDFNDGSVGAWWGGFNATGSYAESGGVLNLTATGGATPYRIYSADTFQNFILESKWMVTATTATPSGIINWRGSPEVTVTGGTTDQLYIYDGSKLDFLEYENLDAHLNEWHFVRATCAGSTVTGYARNLETGTTGTVSATVSTTSAGTIGLGAWNPTTTVHFDDVRVRAYASPTPEWYEWSAEEALTETTESSTLLDYNSQRKVVRSVDGYLYRVYVRSDGSNNRVYYGRSIDNGATWSATVLSAAGVNAGHPTITTDANGTLYVAYERAGGIVYRLYEGTSWSTVATLAASGTAPSLTCDADDAIHAVWNTSGLIQYSMYNGSAWNATSNVSSSVDTQAYPSIAASADAIHIVWQEYNATNTTWSIKYTTSLNNSDALSTNYNYNQTGVSIAVDSDDYVHTTWKSGDGTILYRLYDTAWNSIETVFSDATYSQMNPTISVDQSSIPYVTWYGHTASSSSIWVIRNSYKSGSWQTPTTPVSVAGINVSIPQSVHARYPVLCGDCYVDMAYDGYGIAYSRGGTIVYYNESIWGCDDQYTLAIIAKDASSNTVITNFTVDFSTGESESTTNGVVRFTCLAAGYYQATLSAEDYYPSQTSITLDQSKESIVYLTPITEDTYVLPASHMVEIRAVSMFGQPVPNLNITATGIETSGAWDWLTSIFGFENATEIQNTTMFGTSDSNGAVTFMMVETIRYQITLINDASGVNETISLYPKEAQYTVIIPPSVATDISDVVTWNLTVQEINSSYAWLNLTYNDTVNRTTDLEFFVLNISKTQLYNVSYSDQSVINVSYVAEYTTGTGLYWGFNATHTDYLTFQEIKFVRFEGRLIDLNLTNESYYNWISIALMFFVTMMFSATSAKFGYITVPGLGAFLWWIGWLEVTSIIMIMALILGVLLYIGKKEREESL